MTMVIKIAICSLERGFQFCSLLDGFDHAFEVVRSVVAVTVDVEGWGALDFGGDAAVEVGLDARDVGSFGESVLEVFGGEAERDCGLEEHGVAQITLVLEESVVHLPELAVGGGELGCFGGVLGVGMHLQRKVAEDEAETIAEVLL